MQKGFWHYLELWRERFPRRRPLHWRGDWLQNGYCRALPLLLAARRIPILLSPWRCCQASSVPNLDHDFILLNADTAYLDARGCKADTAQGCRLPHAQRPVACGLFPLVLANGSLYLYKTCPAVIFTPLERLAALGLEAGRWLTGFSLANLRHISLDLCEQTLAERYISLSIGIFDEKGVRLNLR